MNNLPKVAQPKESEAGMKSRYVPQTFMHHSLSVVAEFSFLLSLFLV